MQTIPCLGERRRRAAKPAKRNMSVHPQQESPTERRDRLRSEFATELNDGKRPSIEDYLSRLSEGEQSELLAELVRADHVFRWQACQRPTLSDYTARFPNHAEAIGRVCFAKPDAGGVAYALVGAIADGGQATLYLARDNKRDQPVVVKVARESSEEFAAQLKQESQFLTGARHPLIVPIVDYFECAGRPIIVLEYVQGKTLEAKLKSDGPFAPPDAALIIEQISDAVHYVHESMGVGGKALVHRDLKPTHVILDRRDGRPRLLDFGLAGYEESTTGSRSAAHRGTLEYMSPEQARAFLQGDCLVDRRSDVWALGAIFFELLTAQRPFGTRPKRECLASADDWSKAIESYLAPRTRDSGPSIVGCADMGIPEALRTIVERCVEKRPDARFQSAGELTQALRQWRESMAGAFTDERIG